VKRGGYLPTGIEIFRPGRHIDDAGVARDFTDEDVRRMAEVYNPGQREAPLCVGHPEHDLPAYGYVKGLSVNAAGRLAMDTHQVPPQFSELVRTGAYKKRSAAFYPPTHPNNPAPGAWYLRHVAFLGAQPPAIAGLADIQFGDDAAGLVAFSEEQPRNPAPTKEPPTMTDEEKTELQRQLAAAQEAQSAAQAQLATAQAERDAARAEAANFAEQRKAERLAEFTRFADAQVAAQHLNPKDRAMSIAALNALADMQPVEFAEGNTTRKESLAQWLQNLIAKPAPTVRFGEFRPGQAPQPGAARGKSDAEIDAAAKAYAAQHKVSYAEALSAVASFTS